MTVREYFLPQSIDEAVELLRDHGPALLIMAGGTLAMPLINEGVSFPELVMGLRRAGLSYVARANGDLAIGAATPLSRLLETDTYPILQQAASHVGGWAIRNMATVGGNLFAPPPAGDFAAALLALDARLKLVSPAGERILPISDFYTGFMTTSLLENELVAEVTVPAPKGRTAYLKYGRKRSNTPAIVTVAVQVMFQGNQVTEARLALNGVGPYPFRASRAEQLLVGAPLTEESIAAAAQAAAQDCQPFTDPVASEWYRRKMVAVYLSRTLTQASG